MGAAPASGERKSLKKKKIAHKYEKRNGGLREQKITGREPRRAFDSFSPIREGGVARQSSVGQYKKGVSEVISSKPSKGA